MDTIYSILGTILPLEAYQYTFMKNAFLAILLLTPLLGLLGTMAVNHQMAFFSDALGHSALTGIGLGIILGLRSDLVGFQGQDGAEDAVDRFHYSASSSSPL